MATLYWRAKGLDPNSRPQSAAETFLSFMLFQFAKGQRAITQKNEKKGCLCFLVLSECAHFHPCGYGRVLLTGHPPPVVLWLSTLLSWISVLVNHESLVSINLQQIPAAIFGVFTIESPGTESKVSVWWGVITRMLHQRWRMDERPCERASLWLRSRFVCVFSKTAKCLIVKNQLISVRIWIRDSVSDASGLNRASWRFLSAAERQMFTVWATIAVKQEHRHI